MDACTCVETIWWQVQSWLHYHVISDVWIHKWQLHNDVFKTGVVSWTVDTCYQEMLANRIVYVKIIAWYIFGTSYVLVQVGRAYWATSGPTRVTQVVCHAFGQSSAEEHKIWIDVCRFKWSTKAGASMNSYQPAAGTFYHSIQLSVIRYCCNSLWPFTGNSSCNSQQSSQQLGRKHIEKEVLVRATTKNIIQQTSKGRSWQGCQGTSSTKLVRILHT